MRIDYPDEPQVVTAHPSYHHLYTIPPVHNIPVREDPPTPEPKKRDPKVKNNGIQVFVHYATGCYPDDKVRVAFCVQHNKDIVFDDKGALCFYATSGKNPNTKMVKGQPDRSAMGDVIVWNEKLEFVRDFHQFLWDRWDEDKVKKDLWLIVQYL